MLRAKQGRSCRVLDAAHNHSHRRRSHPLQVSVSKAASPCTAREHTLPTPCRAAMASQGESARVGGRSTVPAKDFVPKGQREVLHGVSCSIREDATASWTTREHLCDTVRGGGEEEGALEARSTEQKRELRRENRWQTDNARIRETAGDETLDV